MAFLGGDEVGAIILDIGSALTKVGFAGDSEPKSSFPSLVGITYEGNNVVGSNSTQIGDNMDVDSVSVSKKRFHVGTEDLSFRRDHMDIYSPFEDGLIKDWDLAESLLSFGLTNRLRIDPKEYPLLMVEPAFNTRQNREKITELIFEKYEAPALFVSKDAVLSCFSSGRATGLVLDSGGGKTSTVAVHDGYVLQQSIRRSPIAGNRLDREVLKHLELRFPEHSIVPGYQITKRDIGGGKFKVTLQEYPNTLPSYSQFRLHELAADIRHSICTVSPSAYEPNQTIPTIPYELPDGKVLEIGAERLLIPEIMFNPQLSKLEHEGPLRGVHSMIVESIDQCDLDVRRELHSGIIITGGNTLYSGFVERLTSELANSVSQKVKIISSNYAVERRCGAWIGGSILGSLGTFQQMWMSKAEYEERGKSLVERKCP